MRLRPQTPTSNIVIKSQFTSFHVLLRNVTTYDLLDFCHIMLQNAFSYTYVMSCGLLLHITCQISHLIKQKHQQQ